MQKIEIVCEEQNYNVCGNLLKFEKIEIFCKICITIPASFLFCQVIHLHYKYINNAMLDTFVSMNITFNITYIP